jgi:hypothetical protein
MLHKHVLFTRMSTICCSRAYDGLIIIAAQYSQKRSHSLCLQHYSSDHFMFTSISHSVYLCLMYMKRQRIIIQRSSVEVITNPKFQSLRNGPEPMARCKEVKHSLAPIGGGRCFAPTTTLSVWCSMHFALLTVFVICGQDLFTASLSPSLRMHPFIPC